MKPTHQEKLFTATRIFTNREKAKDIFFNSLKKQQTIEEYRGINWYGVGGQGKTALCHELQKQLKERLSEIKDECNFDKIGWALVDFDNPTMRHLEEAMLSLRLQLASTVGGKYPAFDIAFARYFALVNPGIDIRKKHPELFKGESEILEDIIDWSEEAVEVTTTVASIFLPGANLLYKYGARLVGRMKEWWNRRGKLVLEGLDALTVDQIRQKLPTFLGSDLFDNLQKNSDNRIVIFFDTYEALWREKGKNLRISGFRVDEWVRKFVQESPGVLFVIFGRDRIKWDEVNSEWSDVLDRHILGNLSDNDAHHFLNTIPIKESNIQNKIVESAKGLPFFLDLQVDLYEKIINDGEKPKSDQFGGTHPEILARFIDHLGSFEEQLRLASYPKILDEKIMIALVDKFLGGAAQLDWNLFCSWSFISSGLANRINMHSIMREELQNTDFQNRPELFREIHIFLSGLFAELSSVNKIEKHNAETDELFLAAAEHLLISDPKAFPKWLDDKFESRFRANRYSVLLKTLELAIQDESRMNGWTIEEQVNIYRGFGFVFLVLDESNKKSVQYFERSLKLCRDNKNKVENKLLAESIQCIADLIHVSEIDRRENLFNEAVSLFLINEKENLESIVDCMAELGEIARIRGNNELLKEYYEKAHHYALKFFEYNEENLEESKKQNTKVRKYHTLGNICLNIQKFDEAENLLKTALEKSDEIFGPLDGITIKVAQEYATSMFISKNTYNIQKTINFLEKRLSEIISIVGENHPSQIQYFSSLIPLYHAQNKFKKTEEIIWKKLKIIEDIYGKLSLRYISHKTELLKILIFQNKYQDIINETADFNLKELRDNKDTLFLWIELNSIIATAYLGLENYHKALHIVTSTINFFTNTFNFEHHPSYIELLKIRSSIHSALKDISNAINDIDKVIMLEEQNENPFKLSLARHYAAKATFLYKFQEYFNSIEMNQKVLDIIDSNFDTTELIFKHDILQSIANGYFNLGLFNKALLFQKQASEYRINGGFGTKEEIIQSYANLIIAKTRIGEFQEAEKIAIAAYSKIANDFQNDLILKGQITAQYANSLMNRKRIHTSQELAKEACALLNDKEDYISTFHEAEEVLIKSLIWGGKPDEALPIIQERIKRIDAHKDANWKDKNNSRRLLRYCFFHMAQVEKSLKKHDEALLTGLEKTKDEKYLLPYTLWNVIYDLIDLHLYVGNFDLALKYSQDLLSQLNGNLNVHNLWFSHVKIKMAKLKGLKNEWNEAEKLNREALSIAKKIYSGNESSEPKILEIPYISSLSLSLFELKKNDESLKLANLVLVLLKYNENEPLAWELAYETVEVLARNDVNNGESQKAVNLLEKAKSILESTGIKNYITLARYLNLLAWVHIAEGNKDLAQKYATEALDITVNRHGNQHIYAKKSKELLDSI